MDAIKIIMFLEKNREFPIIFAIIIAVEIFMVSSIQRIRINNIGFLDLSVFYHIIVFFLLSFFLLISINGKKVKIENTLLVLLIAVTYAILDEIHQFFVPFRDPTTKDILMDILGISLSTVFYIYEKNKK